MCTHNDFRSCAHTRHREGSRTGGLEKARGATEKSNIQRSSQRRAGESDPHLARLQFVCLLRTTPQHIPSCDLNAREQEPRARAEQGERAAGCMSFEWRLRACCNPPAATRSTHLRGCSRLCSLRRRRRRATGVPARRDMCGRASERPCRRVGEGAAESGVLRYASRGARRAAHGRAGRGAW